MQEQRCPDCKKMLGETQDGMVHIRHGDHHAYITLALICPKCGSISSINKLDQATIESTAQKAVDSNETK